MIRATESLLPPTGNGMTRRTIFPGNACASTPVPEVPSAATTAAVHSARFMRSGYASGTVRSTRVVILRGIADEEEVNHEKVGADSAVDPPRLSRRMGARAEISEPAHTVGGRLVSERRERHPRAHGGAEARGG